LAKKRDKRHEILNGITAEVSKVVVGKQDIKELLLVALLSQGHVLIEGLPGTAKTTLARTFAQVIGGTFKRVQGTPDMLPADILGFYLYRPDGSSQFMPGPIFANMLLADELNRTTPRTQAALLEAMQEQQVTIERETHPLERPFIVIASQVPYGGPGTSPLSDVQVDRFMFRIWSDFPSSQEEGQILEEIDRILEMEVSPVATLADIVELQEEVKKVYVAEDIRHYIVAVLKSLRRHQDLLLGPSPRAGIALLKGARALAFIQGRDFVLPDDVKRLLPLALSHRLRVSAEAEMDGVTPGAIIGSVAAEVPVPKGDAAGGAGEGDEAAGEDAEVLTGATAGADSVVSEIDRETVVESSLPTGTEESPVEAQEVSGQAEEVLSRVEEPGKKMISDRVWLVVVVCALIIGAVMICVGMLSFR